MITRAMLYACGLLSTAWPVVTMATSHLTEINCNNSPPQCARKTVPPTDCRRSVGGLYKVTDSACVAKLKALQQRYDAELRLCENNRHAFEAACEGGGGFVAQEDLIPPGDMP